jgi:hypothetical protein
MTAGSIFKPTMFRVFPKGRREWLRAALFLFQAYIPVAYCVEQYFIRQTPWAYRGALDEFKGDVILGYAVCLLVLLGVGLGQIAVSRWRRGFLNFGLAALGAVIAFRMNNFVTA